MRKSFSREHVEMKLQQEGFRRLTNVEMASELAPDTDSFYFSGYNPRGENVEIQVTQKDNRNFAIYSKDGESYNKFEGGFQGD